MRFLKIIVFQIFSRMSQFHGLALVGTCYRPPEMSSDEVEFFISTFQESINKSLSGGCKQTGKLEDFNDYVPNVERIS